MTVNALKYNLGIKFRVTHLSVIAGCFLITSGFADIGVREGLAMSFSDLEKLAEKGDVRAQVILGDRYFLGNGLEQDAKRAKALYQSGALLGDPIAQHRFGRTFYVNTDYSPAEDHYRQAVSWLQKSADQGYAMAQADLAFMYLVSWGVPLDPAKASELNLKAAEQGHAKALGSLGERLTTDSDATKKFQLELFRRAAVLGEPWYQARLGDIYYEADAAERDVGEARVWYERAALQGEVRAQFGLGRMFFRGDGVPKNALEAYKWLTLATGSSDWLEDTRREQALAAVNALEGQMSPEQIARAQAEAKAFVPDLMTRWKWQHDIDVEFVKKHYPSSRDPKPTPSDPNAPSATGSGFAITNDGYIATNYHVVEGAKKILVRVGSEHLNAKVVKDDQANDLVILQANASFQALPIDVTKGVRLGEAVFTVGFPNPTIQGVAPKYTDGKVSSLSGILDDPRHFQVSIPVQPGNSGGALIDANGNVVGVISHKLRQSEVLKETGFLAENVNYAIKGALLIELIRSVPELTDRLPNPTVKTPAENDRVDIATKAAVLIEAYR